MSEQTLPTASPDPGATPTQTPDTGGQPQTAEDKGPIPFERWEQTNQRMKAAEAKLAELAKAEEARATEAQKAEEARLLEEKKHLELAERYKAEAEGLKPHQVKAERYAAALTSLLETERKGLPKHIIELLDKMDPADQLEYIAKNKSVLSPVAPPDINGASRGRGAAGMSDAEKAAFASELGIDPRYLK